MRGNAAPDEEPIAFEAAALVMIAELLEQSFVETVVRYGELDPGRAHSALDDTIVLLDDILGQREQRLQARTDRTIVQIVRATLHIVVDNARARLPPVDSGERA